MKKKRLDDFPDLQRLSIVSGVFYVHQTPRSAPARQLVTEEPLIREAASETDAVGSLATDEPEASAQTGTAGESEAPVLEAAGADTTGTTDSGPDPDARSADDPYSSPAPRGFAYEFGTGRLVRILYTPNGGLLTYPEGS